MWGNKTTRIRMLLAQEDWDSNLGCYRPCGVSPTWTTDKSIVNVPFTLGEYLTKDLKSKGFEILNTFISKEYENSKYVNIKKLNKENRNYFYLINIYEPNFFMLNNQTGFIHLGEKTLNDVRIGKCKIILIQDVEGMSGMKNTIHENEFLLIDEWCRRLNLPFENVYYICGNLLCNKVAKSQNVNVNIIPVSVFESWVNVHNFPKGVVNFQPEDDKYLYLNYSRRPRLHRTFFLLEIIKENLENCGYWSFNTMNNIPPTDTLLKLDGDLEPYINYLYNNSPFIIDRENESDDITVYIPIKDYERTFITIAGETLYEENILFLTEKTFKPIMAGSPFIINGNLNTLKYLKDEGYKTFDKWIDESYDSELNLEVKVKKIINELKRLKEKSIQELIDIRNEMKPICEHNKNLIIKKTEDKFLMNNLYQYFKPTSDILNDIWDKWNKLNYDVNKKII